MLAQYMLNLPLATLLGVDVHLIVAGRYGNLCDRQRERESFQGIVLLSNLHSLLLSPFQQWHVIGPRINWCTSGISLAVKIDTLTRCTRSVAVGGGCLPLLLALTADSGQSTRSLSLSLTHTNTHTHRGNENCATVTALLGEFSARTKCFRACAFSAPREEKLYAGSIYDGCRVVSVAIRLYLWRGG